MPALRLRAAGLRPSRDLVALLALGLAAPAGADEAAVHAFLEKTVRLTAAQIAAVERGDVVTKQLPAADKPEMAAFGAVLVSARRETFLARFRDIVRFRRGPSVLEIGRLGNPPRIEDLDGLTAEESDLEALQRCRTGACEVKMSRSAMDRVRREVDWSAPDAGTRATAVLKQMLVDYAAAYMKGGTPEMATYFDKDKPLDTPAEFRKVLAASPYLIEYVPAFHRYLEGFPAGRPEGAEDLFYWTKDRFGLKPTVALYHVSLWPDADHVVIASKQIYASHYFQAGLDLTALVDAPGRSGFYLMDLYRARVDPPTGLLAGVLLGKIRGGIEEGVAEGLKTAKARTEAR